MKLIDSHAHLYYAQLKENIDEILDNAQEAGIIKITVPAIDYESSLEVMELCEKYDQLYAAIGFHPTEVKERDIDELAGIEELAKHPKVAAIGETGLDYHWDTTFNEKQIEFFEGQIEIAAKYNLPVVVHTRDSIDDALSSVIRFNKISRLTGEKCNFHFHCFSGGSDHLNVAMHEKNIYVSYCGNITYKNYSALEVVSQTPLNRLLSETDSPFLPPNSRRGKNNEPSLMVETLKFIADLKQVSFDELTQAIYDNTKKIFFKLNLD